MVSAQDDNQLYVAQRWLCTLPKLGIGLVTSGIVDVRTYLGMRQCSAERQTADLECPWCRRTWRPVARAVGESERTLGSYAVGLGVERTLRLRTELVAAPRALVWVCWEGWMTAPAARLPPVIW